jgi:hypothetical protein
MNLDAEKSCQLFNPAPAPLVALFIGFTAPYLYSKRRVINSPLHPRVTNCRGDQKKKKDKSHNPSIPLLRPTRGFCFFSFACSVLVSGREQSAFHVTKRSFAWLKPLCMRVLIWALGEKYLSILRSPDLANGSRLLNYDSTSANFHSCLSAKLCFGVSVDSSFLTFPL